MLLIYAEETEPTGSQEERDAEWEKWGTYTNDMQEAGAMVAGEALRPSTTATTVRVREGERVTSDGPFTETKEVLGGYYLIDVDSIDDAIEWAARCPAAFYGSMEVRPILPMEELVPAE
ncbi:MAG: YciI family protein [Nitriliruptorales bacterium]